MRRHVSRRWLADRRARVLLLTDSMAAWRFRRRFVDAGWAQVYLDDDATDIAPACERIARWRPDLVLVSLRSLSMASLAAACGIDEPAPALLFQTGAAQWSRQPSPPSLPGSEREQIEGLIALVRFLQGVRREGVPCVDFADLGAWLAGSRQATFVFATGRLPPPGAGMAPALRAWLGDRMRLLNAPIASAFCIDAPFEGNAMSTWHAVHEAMRGLGAVPAFGAMPACDRPRGAARRWSVGLAGMPARSGAACRPRP